MDKNIIVIRTKEGLSTYTKAAWLFAWAFVYLMGIFTGLFIFYCFL